MDNSNEAKLYESSRLLVRKLGILEKSEVSCCGVTMAQCYAMVEVGKLESISLNELAEILNLDSSTMSRTVNNLVESGLVKRDIDPKDRRYVTISLTENGKKSFKMIDENMKEYFRKVYDAIPEDKREQVLESMDILLGALSENMCC